MNTIQDFILSQDALASSNHLNNSKDILNYLYNNQLPEALPSISEDDIAKNVITADSAELLMKQFLLLLQQIPQFTPPTFISPGALNLKDNVDKEIASILKNANATHLLKQESNNSDSSKKNSKETKDNTGQTPLYLTPVYYPPHAAANIYHPMPQAVAHHPQPTIVNIPHYTASHPYPYPNILSPYIPTSNTSTTDNNQNTRNNYSKTCYYT